MSESSRKHPTVKTEFIAIADAYPSHKKKSQYVSESL